MTAEADKTNALDGIGANPVLDGVSGEEPKADQQQQFDALKEVLGQFNINSPDDFTAIVQEHQKYKKGYGQSQNEVGELRRQLQEVQQQLSQKQAEYPYGDDEAVDLAKLMGPVIRQTLNDFWGEKQKEQIMQEERVYAERSELEARPGWKQVQPHFDKALQNPQVRQLLRSGAITQKELYSRINESVLMNTVNKFINTIPQGAVQPPPPEFDTSSRIAQDPNDREQQKQNIEKAKANNDIGGVLKNILGDNDPIMR